MPFGKNYRSWAALALSLAFVPPAAAEIPVYIFAGQSNMVGDQTNVGDLTAAQQAVQPNVFFSNTIDLNPVPNWSLLQPPTEGGNRFGPEVSAPLVISNSLAGQKVAAVKFSLNNSPLQQSPSFADWSPSNSDELFFGVTTQTANALATLPSFGPANGQGGVVKGFFFMQGEADANDDYANLYQHNLVNFISAIRASQGDPNLPFVMGLIANAGPHTDTIRRAQMNVARLVSGVAAVETADLERAPFPNLVHLSSQGTYDLGLRMGQAHLGLLNPLPQGPASMNLVSNGGFEDYAISNFAPFPGTLNGQTYPSNGVPGWQGATPDGYTLVNQSAFGPAAQGQQFLSLENSAFGPGDGGAQQTVALTNGQMYTVLFSFSAISFGDNLTQQFSFDRDGAGTQTFNISTNGINQNSMAAWQTASVTFTATDASETLRFLPTATSGVGFYGPAIDNVRVVQGSVWNDTGGSDDWATSTNWVNNVIPDSVGAIANFLETASVKTVDVDGLGDGFATIGSLRIDSPASYTFASGDTLQFNASSGQNATIIVERGSHTINAAVDFQENIVDVSIAAGSTLTIAGQIEDPSFNSALYKFGAGTLVLSNSDNTYDGPTHIVEGTLRLANSGDSNNITDSSTITVYRGATFDVSGLSGGGRIILSSGQSLRGSGTIRGGVNATASGTSIVPGTSVGQMTFVGAGAITLDPSTTLTFEVGGNGSDPGMAGINYDQIVIDGTGLGSPKTFTTGGATLNLIALPGLAHGTPYMLIRAVGNANIDFATIFAGLAENVIHQDDGLFFSVNYESTFFTATFYVPEPSSLALLSFGAIALLKRRRDR